MNTILHALANRPGPFQDPLLVASPRFVPAVPPPRVAQLQAALFLDVTHTDHYLKVYLALLDAHPDLKALFGRDQTTYRPGDFLPRGVWLDGAELLSAPGIGGRFTDPADPGLPLNFNYRIDFVEPGLCQITAVERGLVRRATCRLTGNDPNALLQIEWPADIPFTGTLRLTQNWERNARVQIEVAPGQFPYTALLARVTNCPFTSELLVRFGLVDEFNGSPDVTEKLALVLACLGLSNPAGRA